MQKFTDILITSVAATALFTVCNLSNALRHFYISLGSYIICFFIAGWLMSLYYNKTTIRITFLITIGLLMSSIFYVRTQADFDIIQFTLFMYLSFTFGHYFSRMKWNKRGLVSSILLTAYLVIAFIFYPKVILAGITDVNPPSSSNRIISQAKSFHIIDHKGRKRELNFADGKVYLLEFYFKNCLPCKLKQKALTKLKTTVNNSQFNIIYIQDGTIDDFSTFQTVCRTEGTENRFFDSSGSLIASLKVTGYPTEFLIDGKGKIRNVVRGFSADLESEYINATTKKVNELLSEKRL
jgi:peroxiredoxin